MTSRASPDGAGSELMAGCTRVFLASRESLRAMSEVDKKNFLMTHGGVDGLSPSTNGEGGSPGWGSELMVGCARVFLFWHPGSP